jgi:hypothetical protein
LTLALRDLSEHTVQVKALTLSYHRISMCARYELGLKDLILAVVRFISSGFLAENVAEAVDQRLSDCEVVSWTRQKQARPLSSDFVTLLNLMTV